MRREEIERGNRVAKTMVTIKQAEVDLLAHGLTHEVVIKINEIRDIRGEKLEQADENKIDVPLMFKQGGARIVYTKCDEDLMGEVFADLKGSFDKIAAMDAKLSSNRVAKLTRTAVEQRAVRQGPLNQSSEVRVA